MAAAVIVGAAFFWRLSQGPVSLAFMTPRIEAAVNRELKGLSVKLGGAILELDQKTQVPHLRFRDLVLADSDGTVIARASRAAVALEGGALLTGSIVPRSLELIGSKVQARRNLDGTFELGIGDAGAPEDANQEVMIDDLAAPASDGKTDMGGAPPPTGNSDTFAGSRLINLLASDDATSPLSALEDIRITGASVNLYDEANDATWFAPRADMTFRKMPYGFVVFAKAEVASGGDPWNTELSASYRTSSKSFSISTRIDGLVPANVADEVYALAQLARVNIPLSGHAEMETDSEGHIAKASAEFAAAAGVVSLPDFIAQPIVVDEGSLRFDYDAATGAFNIVDSSLLVGGSRAELVGSILPVNGEGGRLSFLDINLKARNVDVDTQGTVRDPVRVDRIEFSGRAAIEEAVLDISDLVVMSGNTGVRLRGSITGGNESAGISMAGRVRDISADFLKRIWPPIITPKTRTWVNENIISGRVAEGAFTINIPVDGLAKAQRERLLPDETVDFSFKLADVSTRYFRKLPALEDAAGEARLRGNSFELKMTAGHAVMPSGADVRLNSGSFKARDLLAVDVPGEFSFNLGSSFDGLVEFARLPDLGNVAGAITKLPKITGKASALIGLKLPLRKDVPREQVSLTTSVKLTDADIANILPGIDLTDGNFDIAIGRDGISAKGPAKLNGFAASLLWKKEPGEGGAQSAEFSGTLDDQARAKLGIKLEGLIKGPVPVTAKLENIGKPDSLVHVDADLSKVSMSVPAIKWSREATPKTRASFTLQNGKNGRSVKDLVVKGGEFGLAGDVDLTAEGGIRVANFSEVRLDADNIFAVRVEPREGETEITVTGRSYDAQPQIRQMFSPAAGSGGGAKALTGERLVVNARFSKVYANRGEVIEDVTAQFVTRGGTVTEADMRGKFVNGAPISLRVIPVNGGREMRVVSTDAGAALRATNLYSKVAGGSLEFYAFMANDTSSSIKQGKLNIRNFEVRNEAALADISQKGKQKKSGPRKGGLVFKRLALPFTTDGRFLRIGESIVKGNELGATAEGVIRKTDGAIDITGTIIPAYGINAAVGDIPLVGDILTGGNDEGVFGLTYALGGTMAKPKFQINPVSAIAPGILRRFFDFGNGSGATMKPGQGSGDR
jgi:hypothetical protein